MLKILETIDFLSIIAMLFSLQIVFAMPVVYGVYYVITRRKGEWRKNVFAWPDLLSPLVVGVVWMMVEAVNNVKSLSNLAIEPFMIGVIWCAAWIVRLSCFSRVSCDKNKVSWTMLVLIGLTTLIVTFCVPCLPE